MNAFCTNCYGQAAKFCICQNSATVLCDVCLRKHETNLPYEIHDSSPLAYYSVLQDLGIEGFRARKMQISSGAVFVRKLEEEELRQYQQARAEIEQISALYLQWIDYLHNAFTQIMQRFNQEKLVPMTSSQPQISQFTYFAYSVGEVGLQGIQLVEGEPLKKFKSDVEGLQQSLYRSSGPANDYQDYFIAAITAGLQASSPQYATYSPPAQSYATLPYQPSYQPTYQPAYQPSSQPSVPIPIQPTVQRYVLRDKPFATYLPFSRGNMLGKWDTRSQNLARLQLPRRLNVSKHTVSAVLPSGDVCFIGGRQQNSRMAVVIDAESGSICDLGDMNQGRANAGLVYLDRALYIFGGAGQGDTGHSSAEKYSFDQGAAWRSISAQMADSRWQFNPAGYQQIIYIAGGYFSQKVETFHTIHETFRIIPLSLPKSFATIVLVHNNELLVIQETTLTRWRISSDSAQQQSINLKLGESNTCPQTYGNRVFFNEERDNSCDILVLELDSMSVVKVDGLKNGSGQEQCPVS
jgi:hypothetical protein